MRSLAVISVWVAVALGVTANPVGGHAADAARSVTGSLANAGLSLDQRTTLTFQDEFRITAGDRIFFADGSIEIGSRARAVLRRQAEWLKLHPELVVAIEGHADDSASLEEMKLMSQNRAVSVRDRLIAEGVDGQRITVVAKSNTDVVATCALTGCKAQNRRVITLISGRLAPALVAPQQRQGQPNAVRR